ncbi:MAG: flagellar hook protein FlgE [Fimbriimonadaceae bacterium]|nr:flagellar hook protein FlgE [Fimbriimonadaceae bacterium]
MSRTFSTAMSSLQTHVVGIDIHANNIANLNTSGYKTQRAQFKSLFSQNLRSARGATDGLAGLDPLQVGAGVRLGTTATQYAQGSLIHTGENLDLAILGRGFFMLQDADGNEFYSRDGALTLDANGRLSHASSGLAVQGLLYDTTTNTIPDGALPTDIDIPPGLTLNAKATSTAQIAGNLNAATTVGEATQMQYRYHDSFGVSHVMTVTFTRAAAANTWNWTAQVGTGPTTVGSGALVFNAVGDVATGGIGTCNITAASGGVTAGGTDPQEIELDLAKLTQFAAPSEVETTNQDGFPPGFLVDVVTDDVGRVSAVFSNGQTRPLAQLAIVNFANLQGLNRKADNLFQQSANTGSPQVVTAGNAGAGNIQAQTLERSNTDLANELTTLIILQRGYQAATRMITTADEIMQDALSLKR